MQSFGWPAPAASRWRSRPPAQLGWQRHATIQRTSSFRVDRSLARQILAGSFRQPPTFAHQIRPAAPSLKRVLGFRSTRSADGRQPAPKNVGFPPASDRSRPEDMEARSLALAQGHCKNPCRASASCGTRIAKALAAEVRRINCSGALRWPWPGTGLQCRACTSSCRLLRSARSSSRSTGRRAGSAGPGWAQVPR